MKKEHGRSATAKGAKGKTDWEKLRALPDPEVVFTDDAPVTSPEDWVNAIAHKGLPIPSRKTQIALRVDDDVLAWFKAQGAGYQTRMNAVLRAFRDAHMRSTEAQRIRLDCVSEANHNLNRLLDEPEGGIMDGPEKTARKAP